MSDCLLPYELGPARLFCPWGFSRQEYWSELHSLLQGISPTRDLTQISCIAGRLCLSHHGSPAFLLKTFLAPPGTSPWWNWHRLCLHSFLWAAGDRLCTISAKDRWQKDGRHKQHGRRLRVWLQKVLCVTVKLPLWLLGRLVMREMTPRSWHLAKASLKGKLNVYLFYPVTLKHKIKKKNLIKIAVNMPVVIILLGSVSHKLPGRELSGWAHH